MDVDRPRVRTADRRRRWPAPILAIAWLSGCAMLGPTTATSFLKQVESDPDPNVRYKAYLALGTERVYDDAGQKRHAAEVLVARLDPNKEPMASRALICRSLGAIGDPVARDPMIRMVRDPDVMIRSEAIRALGKVGRPEDATVLMQAMKLDADPDCKVAAIESLGLLKAVDPRTEAYLVEAMEDNDPAIRLAAYGSLKRLTRKDLGPKPGPWRELVVGRPPSSAATTTPPRRMAIKNPFQPADLGMTPKIARKVYSDPYKAAAADPKAPTVDAAAQPASGRRTFTDPFGRGDANPAPTAVAPPELPATAATASPAKPARVYTDPFKRSEGSMWDPPAGVNSTTDRGPSGP